jgi:hypothetical protein
MKLSEVKGIGEGTEKDLNKIGIMDIEQFSKTPHEQIFSSGVPSGKLAILYNFVGNKCTVEQVDNLRNGINKIADAIKNDKYIGMKLWNSPHDTKLSTVITIHNGRNGLVYEVGDISKSHGNSLYTKEQLKSLIENQDKYENIRKANDEFDKKQQEEENIKLLKKEEEERIERELYLLDDFTANKTSMQKGKILKTLNDQVRYESKFTNFKKMIHMLVVERGANPKIFERDYSVKKSDYGEKLSKPIKEYRLWFGDDGNTFVTVNKTQFEYAEFLADKR